MTLRFCKIVGQIVCIEVDEDGAVVGERSVGEFVAYQPQLDQIPAAIEDAVRRAGAE